ncbi:PAS domain S-box protein [Vineibacter terrae]|uniref:Sensor protein FixL n=1 Tax=Vineibacter terrae TaxID=2586908 RepID=A0A5C8PK42_9HYPH|nr:PAS domain S-box protein [Vineibacter terrae]TXL74247.1 PAS domain S-box protein [Vineibacter terrae]
MRLGLAIMACGTLAAAILVVTFSHRIAAERRLAEEETLRQLQSTSRELDQHAARAFGEAALVLLTIRDELADPVDADALGKPRLGSLLRDQLKRVGTLSNIIVARPDGTIVQAARGVARDDRHLSEAVRQEALSRPDGGPAVSAAPPPDAAGAAVLSVSLLLTDAGGRAAAIVLATIPASHFESMYQAIHAEGRGAVALWRGDGARLLQYPSGEPVGRLGPAFDRVLARSEAGTVRESMADGMARVTAWRTVRGWPLTITVSASDADYLAQWRDNSCWNGISAGIGVVIILGLAALLARYVRRRDLAQAEVARSRRLLADAVDSLPDAFILLDKDDRLLAVNRRYREDFAQLAPLLEPGVRFEAILRVALEHGIFHDAIGREEAWLAQRLRAHRQPGSPFELALADGRWFRVSEHATADGGVVGVRVDITARKRDERRLQQSERQAQAIMDAAVDGLVVIDETGTIKRVNRSVTAMFGYRGDELIGRNVKMLMAEPFRSQHDLYMTRYRDTAAARIVGKGGIEVVGQRQDGTTFPVDLVVGELMLDERRYFIGAMRDISDRVAIKEQLAHAQKMEAVGQLTGGLAHDFNNLLQVVMTNLELVLDRGGRDDDMALRAADALRAAERGAELTGQMLAFARRQTLSPRRTDLGALIEALVGLLRRTLGENIAIDLRLASPLRDVMIDRGQLENALLNLALNARDAMPHGGCLRIAADNVDFDDERADRHAEARHGRFVAITIADTGVGMSDAVRMRAFEPFFTTKDIGKGSGLGLSMVYGFVKQSGGHIELDSVPGGGTTLTLYLPEAVPPAAADAGARPAPEPPADGRGEAVLVVEDNDDVRRLAVTLLKALGYGVIEAADGPAALGVLDTGADVDLLLTDVMLASDMSGPDVARAARARRPGLKLAYMSGYTGAARGQPALDPGVTLIAKPFTRAGFARAIRAALDG